MNRTLVIGIGNTLRSDDGAGILAAQMFAEDRPDCDLMLVHELVPEAAETISHYDSVVFLDASELALDVQVTSIGPSKNPPAFNSHALSPRSVVDTCTFLYERVPSRIALVEIPGRSFDLGETCSEFTRRMITKSVNTVETLLRLNAELARERT